VNKLELLAVLFLTGALFAQSSTPKVNGDKNQTAGTNNGVMIQNNITITKPVKKALQKQAQVDGAEQGWLRLLTPANDPMPQSSCDSPNSAMKALGVTAFTMPKDPLLVLLGNYAGYCSGDSCSILQDNHPNADDKNLLSVKRKGNSLLLQAVVFDDSGKVVVKLVDDKPHINRNNVFDVKRPDEHTLEVIDQRDRTVLHVRFVNKTTVYVEGIFYTPSGSRLKATGQGVQLQPNPRSGTISLGGGCAANVPASGAVFAF